MSNIMNVCVFLLVLFSAISFSVSAERSWNNRAYQTTSLMNSLPKHKTPTQPIATHLASNAIPRKARAHRRRQSSQQPQSQQPQSQQLTGSLSLPEVTQEYPETQYRISTLSSSPSISSSMSSLSTSPSSSSSSSSSPSSSSLLSSSSSSSSSSLLFSSSSPSSSSSSGRMNQQQTIDDAQQSALAVYQTYLNQNPMIPLSVKNQMLYRHQILPHQLPFQIASSNPSASIAIANEKKLNSLTSKKSKPGQWWNLVKTPMNLPVNVAADADLNGLHTNAIVPSGPSSAASSNAIVSSIKVPNLRKKQKKIIKDNPGLLLAIAKAMRLAIHECQHQFKDRRWNCPVNEWKKGKSIFGRIIQTGCRETAFVYALTSAAVAHSIARACSEGLIETCTCDYTPNRLTSGNDWEWGGCSDNIKFGYKFARSFVDAAENSRDHRFVMNMHNNEVGRTHVSQMMRRECKCHGMSGSCTVKTCWMKLAPFNEIGNTLKDRFDGASRVRIGNDFRDYKELRKSAYRKIPVEPYESGYKTPSGKDLIYFDESPDFCVANPKYGVAGTPGRICNASSIGVDGCNLLCCGRGYETEEVEVTERCNCTFQWCCQVHCQSCKVKKKIHRCK